MADLSRIWKGKYGDGNPNYHPIGPKSGGTAVGAIYEKDHTKPTNPNSKKKWLGKMGDGRDQLGPEGSLRDESNLAAVYEKIAADGYTLLSNGIYEVPKHRLAMLPVMNDYTEGNYLATSFLTAVNQGFNLNTAHIMSKWLTDFTPLNKAIVRVDDSGKRVGYMDYIDQHHCPSETLLVDGVEIPLKGLMEILGAARVLGDTDVLGGGGDNVGFRIVRDEDGNPIEAIAIKIDPGCAFNYSDTNVNRFLRSFNPHYTNFTLSDPRNIQFSNSGNSTIHWNKLSETQQADYLKVIQRAETQLSDETLLKLVKRDGAFNSQVGVGILLPDKVADGLIGRISDNIDSQRGVLGNIVYGKELKYLETTMGSQFVLSHAHMLSTGSSTRVFDVELLKKQLADAIETQNWANALRYYYLLSGELGNAQLQDHIDMAELAEELKQWDQAVLHYRTASRLDPNNKDLENALATAYKKQGENYARTGDLSKSLEAYSKALKLRPNDSEIRGSIHTQVFMSHHSQLDHSLDQISQPLNPKDSLNGKVVMRGIFGQNRVLNPDQHDKLFNGPRIIVSAVLGETPYRICVKEMPNLVGIEYAAGTLMYLMVGRGIAASELMVIDRYDADGNKTSYIVQVSKSMEGRTLNAVFAEYKRTGKAPKEIESLDLKQYSEMVIMSLLIRAQDWGGDNLVFKKNDETEKYEIWRVDNTNSFLISEKPPLVNTTLYTMLEEMNYAVYADVIKNFMSMNLLAFLRTWQQELAHFNYMLEQLIPLTERKPLSDRDTERVVMHVFFKPGVLSEIYLRLIQICQEFHTAINVSQETLTHMQLLIAVDPALAQPHKEPQKGDIAVHSRGDAFNTNRALVAYIFDKIMAQLGSTEDEKYLPEAALLELEEVSFGEQSLSFAVPYFEMGKYGTLIMFPPALQKQILQKVDFVEMQRLGIDTRKMHNELKKLLTTEVFQKLYEKELTSLVTGETPVERDVRTIMGGNYSGRSEFKRIFGIDAIDGVSVPALPDGIVDILKGPCPFDEGKNVADTHILVLVPKNLRGEPFTMLKWKEIFDNQNHASIYEDRGFKDRYTWTKEEFATTTVPETEWVLIPKKMLIGTTSLAYSDQENYIKYETNSNDATNYNALSAIELTTGIFLHYLQTGEKLYGEDYRVHDYLPYSRTVDGSIVVGHFGDTGLYVEITDMVNHSIGMHVGRRLTKPQKVRMEAVSIKD